MMQPKHRLIRRILHRRQIAIQIQTKPTYTQMDRPVMRLKPPPKLIILRSELCYVACDVLGVWDHGLAAGWKLDGDPARPDASQAVLDVDGGIRHVAAEAERPVGIPPRGDAVLGGVLVAVVAESRVVPDSGRGEAHVVGGPVPVR